MSGKTANNAEQGICNVEAIVSVDERGQMVLPKDLRTRSGIKAGDKFVLVSWERDGRLCCITLMKADELAGAVKGAIGPLINGITKAR
ncbi:MAG: AbrB/MazE/SpoVT family DNA-binding domain-containing protein [Thermodesulfovibrionales bacterium]|nr:AbrB/MazE/SpoVT family DNA-binding domain-containing protein [Thermodesulfovibrionales bacterium]